LKLSTKTITNKSDNAINLRNSSNNPRACDKKPGFLTTDSRLWLERFCPIYLRAVVIVIG